MNKNLKTLVIIFITLIIGIIIGVSFKELIPNVNTILPIQCSYNGKIYKSGDSFPAQDGCNTCSCQGGKIACTLMACNNSPKF